MRQPSRTLLRPTLYGLVTILITLATTFLQAQTFRGGINGTVTDKTGAAIANATDRRNSNRHGRQALNHKLQRRRVSLSGSSSR